ncbi:hypothetical protein ACFOKF_20420 [Sphingobium rhizovicinum]|uniref:Uncharacterized protein n=1 Tax=Sphingobium rhizovicinum TaxID=432308 RepID=A0ABV7NJ52_9SPHN
MFHGSLQPRSACNGDRSALLDRLAHASSRPRYAYMLLTLIADVARPDGSAGPLVAQDGGLVGLRDWLCDALTPMGGRDPRRLALTERVRAEMAKQGETPSTAAIEEEVKLRVRASGKSNLSRAVSELVAAGLLRRHYQGFRVDHLNRGAQRQAVYTLTGLARALVVRPSAPPPASARARQGELGF